jgi:hypothetical protein
MSSLFIEHYIRHHKQDRLSAQYAAPFVPRRLSRPLGLSELFSDEGPPIGAPGAVLQSPAIATHPIACGSWMLPQAQGSRGTTSLQ